MRSRRGASWTFAVVAALAVFSMVVVAIGSAVTASNTVPATNMKAEQNDPTFPIIAPTACALQPLTAQLSGTGDLSGGNDSELILGGPAAQSLQGGKGDDCIMGGSGNDSLRGDQGYDVCIGGAGTNSFHASCEVQL